MDFVCDQQKNESNIERHGLDFAGAPRIFAAPMLVARDEREQYGEDRCVGLGLLDARVVVIVFSEPEADTVRIISPRKALRHERDRFEQHLQDRLDAG